MMTSCNRYYCRLSFGQDEKMKKNIEKPRNFPLNLSVYIVKQVK